MKTFFDLRLTTRLLLISSPLWAGCVQQVELERPNIVATTPNAAGTNSTPAPTPFPTEGKVHYLGGKVYDIIVNKIDGLQCGDTIAIRAGTYSGITLSNLSGCPGNPIKITNSGGEVILSQWGLELKNIQHAIIRSERPGTYGFKVVAPNRAGASISMSSSNIDISGIHAARGTGYGIVVKTDPNCQVLDHVAPKLISNIDIHDNLIEGTVYEGMYIGYYLKSAVQLNCNGQPVSVLAQRLSKVKIHHNKLRDTGNEAIKVRLCHDGCDISYNSIFGYGVLRQDAGWCFGIQVGSETYSKIVGNVLEYGYCSAINLRAEDSGGRNEIIGNTTSYAGTLPSMASGVSWAGGILVDILAPNVKVTVKDNISSNHLGADLEFTNYGNHVFVGEQCNSGSDIKYSKGMTPLGCGTSL